jgi:putative PIN family toxin of toxin-antitoxin system
VIRAVIDANFFVSGVLGLRRELSPPGRLMHHWFAGSFELVTSKHVATEIERTLAKPFFATRISTADMDLATASLVERAMRVDISVTIRGQATHPEDDRVLATAVSASADYLVTGDAQLQALGNFRGVTILSPRAFLTILDRDVPVSGKI